MPTNTQPDQNDQSSYFFKSSIMSPIKLDSSNSVKNLARQRIYASISQERDRNLQFVKLGELLHEKA